MLESWLVCERKGCEYQVVRNCRFISAPSTASWCQRLSDLNELPAYAFENALVETHHHVSGVDVLIFVRQAATCVGGVLARASAHNKQRTSLDVFSGSVARAAAKSTLNKHQKQTTPHRHFSPQLLQISRQQTKHLRFDLRAQDSTSFWKSLSAKPNLFLPLVIPAPLLITHQAGRPTTTRYQAYLFPTPKPQQTPFLARTSNNNTSTAH